LFAVRVSVLPAHTGAGVVLPFILGIGVLGMLLTTTAVVPAGPVQPFTVTVTEKVPVEAFVTDGILGFCADDVKPDGPVQLYVAPATAGAVRFKVEPAHKGELLPAAGAVGV
jgi:hypothetical protein